jgi:hypothetical protein
VKKRIPGGWHILFTGNSGTTEYIKYAEALRILEVKFRQEERTYQYMGVPRATWLAYKRLLAHGGSSGTFINQEVKPFYRAVELESEWCRSSRKLVRPVRKKR